MSLRAGFAGAAVAAMVLIGAPPVSAGLSSPQATSRAAALLRRRKLIEIFADMPILSSCVAGATTPLAAKLVFLVEIQPSQKAQVTQRPNSALCPQNAAARPLLQMPGRRSG